MYAQPCVTTGYRRRAETVGGDPKRAFGDAQKLAVCLLALAVSLIGLACKACAAARTQKSVRILRAAVEAQPIIVLRLADGAGAEAAQPTATTSYEPTMQPSAAEAAETLSRYAMLWQQNSDLVGWISLEGTQLDYPVMQSVDRKQFYLDHNFEKAHSKAGLPFLEETCKLNGNRANLLLYGHNRKDGSMFAPLHGYLDADFLAAHPTIRFDTLRETGTYEVVCVFLTTLDPSNAFKFFHYPNIDTPAAMEAYVQGLDENNLLDRACNVQWGDQLLTLVTCSRHAKDGRLVVVAKRME